MKNTIRELMTQYDQALTTAQAADLLGLSERQVQYLSARGQIAGAVKLGRDWRFPPDPRVIRPKRGRPAKQP